MEECIFHSRKRPGEYLKYYRQDAALPGKLPLLFYLAGAGSRGDDLSLMGRAGPIGELDRGRRLDCRMIAPQCHTFTWFELFDVVLEFLDECRQDPRVDPNRVYLCGTSMGAYATWSLCMTRPEWIAAAVPVCGGGMAWTAARMKDIPIWAFHGALDPVVSPEESLRLVAAVNQSGGNARITIYPHAQHDAWTAAYGDDAMWRWLFSQQKAEPVPIAETGNIP